MSEVNRKNSSSIRMFQVMLMSAIYVDREVKMLSYSSVLQCWSYHTDQFGSGQTFSCFQPRMPLLTPSTVLCLLQCHSASFLSSRCFHELDTPALLRSSSVQSIHFINGPYLTFGVGRLLHLPSAEAVLTQPNAQPRCNRRSH